MEPLHNSHIWGGNRAVINSGESVCLSISHITKGIIQNVVPETLVNVMKPFYSEVCYFTTNGLIVIYNLNYPQQPLYDFIYLLSISLSTGERKHSFQFTIHTESSWNRRPDFVLASQSEREMKEWIIAFKVS